MTVTQNTTYQTTAQSQSNAQVVASMSGSNQSNSTSNVVSFDGNGHALTDGIVKIYNYDGQGLFLNSEDYKITAGTSVPAQSTTTPPLKAPEGQVSIYDTTKNTWVLIADHRGTVVYDKATGQKGTITAPGDLPSSVTTIAPEQPYSTWDDSTNSWKVNVEARSAALKAQAQAQMRIVMAAKNSNGWDPDINPMPDDVSKYAKALVGFINGTNKTDTELPTPPADLND